MGRTKKNRITIGGNLPTKGQTSQNTIVITQPKRFGIDIHDFTMAVRSAENVDYAQRSKLYDLYTDILMDTHLTSVIEKRVLPILSSDLEFRRNGNPDEIINEQIKSPWFTRLVEDILDSRWWGFSLMQFYKKDGWVDYDLIPRKHIDPVKKIILRRQTDITGIPFDDYKDLLFVGEERDLGMLAKAAPWVIYKRNDVADWAQFAEIFGTPIREYIYETDDSEARQKAISDAKESGGMSVFIHAKDTELQLKEAGNKSGTSDLYDKLCERCNAEISKLFLGNTLTTEAGSKGTQALGTVHKKVEDTIVEADRRYILNVLNYDMTDIFMAMGINTQGGEFYYPKPKDIDKAAKMNILTQAKKTFNLPISDDYLYDEFGIEKPKNYKELKSQSEQEKVKLNPTPSKEELEDEPKDDPLTKKEKNKFTSWFKGFFEEASQDGAHLNW